MTRLSSQTHNGIDSCCDRVTITRREIKKLTVAHDEVEHTVSGAADRETTEQLVLQGLGLSHGAASTVADLFREQLDAVFTEAEALLHQGGQLADAASLFTEHFTSAGGRHDDLRADRSHAWNSMMFDELIDKVTGCR